MPTLTLPTADTQTTARQPTDIAAMQANAARAANFLRALSNERRLLVLCALSDGEMSVSALQAHVGMGQSALSQHLALLRTEGLVDTRRSAQTIYYRIADPAVIAMITTLASIFCPPES